MQVLCLQVCQSFTNVHLASTLPAPLLIGLYTHKVDLQTTFTVVVLMYSRFSDWPFLISNDIWPYQCQLFLYSLRCINVPSEYSNFKRVVLLTKLDLLIKYQVQPICIFDYLMCLQSYQTFAMLTSNDLFTSTHFIMVHQWRYTYQVWSASIMYFLSDTFTTQRCHIYTHILVTIKQYFHNVDDSHGKN